MSDQFNSNRKKDTQKPISPYAGMVFPRMITITHHRFRGLSEAKEMAAQLSIHAPNHSMATMGLTEIFVNAIEHGNLGIEYNTKSNFSSEKEWFNEINRRLLEKANIHKYVEVTTEVTPSYVQFTVSDQGRGFDWKKFQDLKSVPLTDKNGRGILISKEAAFDKLIYYPPGNRVDCIIYK